MKELFNRQDWETYETKEAPRVILSDGKYSIKAFSDRVEVWDLFPGAFKRLATFSSIGSLVKFTGLDKLNGLNL